MKRFILLLLLIAFPVSARAQSISLPIRLPLNCSSKLNNCAYPFVYSGWSGVIVAVSSTSGTITDSLGSVWTRDYCLDFPTGGSDHSCIFHANFTVNGHNQITLSNIGSDFPNSTSGHDVFLLVYQGPLTFDLASEGTYAADNSIFPSCINGQDCQYNWTHPVEVDAGELLISWSDPESSGPGLAKAGIGYSIEISDGFLAIEDMFAPIGDVAYIASMTWYLPTGEPVGGAHWVMGLAAYKRQLTSTWTKEERTNES